MPKQITPEITPEEIVQMANEYQALLAKSNVPMKVEQTIADMERRAADMNGISVEEWKARFEVSAAPVKTKAAAPKKKAERGAVTEIDRDYFYVDPSNQAISSTWMKLRHEMGIVMNMLVIGPSGCGKTELLQRLGREFGVPTYKVDCASITTPDKWVGHKELVATENGQETHYIKSMMLKWLAAEDGYEPGIVIFDEINRLPAGLLNTLIPILDGSQKVWVPDLGIYSEVHKDTMIAATANLGVGYSGTHSMDIALQDRFGVIMESGFPPKDEEVKILMRRTGLDEARAQILVNIATQERSKADAGDLPKYISTRALIDTGFWIGAGMSIVSAAAATFVKKFSGEGRAESDRAAVEIMVKGMAGDQ
jgi:nitric oxide reductase NorQ protein